MRSLSLAGQLHRVFLLEVDTKFRDALQGLKDVKEPVSDPMAKTMFLSKIQDKDYTAIKDILLTSHSDEFEECVTRILDKYNLMGHSKNASNTCQTNKAQGKQDKDKKNRGRGKGNNNNNNNKGGKGGSNKGSIHHYISDEEWNKMFYEER